MKDDVLVLANSPLLWATTAITVGLVVLLAVLYLIKTVRFGKRVGITDQQISSAIRTSLVSSIGPSVVIMVGMIALLIVVGAPTAMMRLSVVGNVSYELTAAGFASNAFGVPLEASAMTPEIFQAIVFVMAVGCIGYLLVPVIFANSFERTLVRINNSGKNKNLAAVISAASILACYAYIEIPYVVAFNASTVALLVGFMAMTILETIQRKTKAKWLLEWGMLIAMFIGMLAGVLAQ